MSHGNDYAPETLAVHAGVDAHEFHPAVPPIYQTSTFGFATAEEGAALFAGKGQGYIYSRMGNPTVQAVEKAVAALEGGYAALACGSGMAAVHTALGTLLKQGDHVVCSEAVYGPTCTLVGSIMSEFGIESTMVDTGDIAAVRAAMRPNTKVVYIETPCNPTLVIADIEAISKLAHEMGALVVVDNTFMGPILQRPFRFGADVIVHSLTKSLNGHADVVGGMVVVRDQEMYAKMRRMLNHFGGVLPPMESFLVHRGIKTLPLRVRAQCENAQIIAEHFEHHPQVEWLCFPGLKSHPQYELAQRQMDGPGAIISFCLKGGIEAGRRMMNAVKLCMLAVSLGGVETLIQHPASMTHASMGAKARCQAHIEDGLVRLSVGIENVKDIIADLEQALEAAASKAKKAEHTVEPAVG
ncbi:MAG: PLP-dependent transferase [Phycisphaerae bacterium]|nr:PLP-dependent transferase [Phycisphaerae bacterium]